MSRKSLFFVFLLLVASFVIVPAVFAQSGSDISVDDIIDAIGPRDGEELIWDMLLYLIFFTSIVSMFLIPDKQLSATLINFTVLFLAVISKLIVSTDPGAVIGPCDLPVLGINAGMFALPLIMAGMVRTRKVGNPPAMITGIATGLMGGAYFFLFWFMAQQGCDAVA